MQPRYSHIIKPDNLISKDLRSPRRFLRHRNITGSAGCHYNFTNSIRLRQLPDNTDSGNFLILQGLGFRYHLCPLFGQSGYQNGFLSLFLHGFHDSRYLLRCLSCPVDNLRSSLPNLAVHIHLCIADIFKGFHFQPEQGILHRGFPRLYSFQKLSDFTVHPLASKSSSTPR